MPLHKKISLVLPFLFQISACLAFAQRVTLLSGDGLLLRPAQRITLTVLVTDAQGKPLPNATVTWVIDEGPGSLAFRQSQTDTRGQATNLFTAQPGLAGANITRTQVIASYSSSDAPMRIYTPASDTNIKAELPGTFPTITGAAGATGATPLSVRVSLVGPRGTETSGVLVRVVSTAALP